VADSRRDEMSGQQRTRHPVTRARARDERLRPADDRRLGNPRGLHGCHDHQIDGNEDRRGIARPVRRASSARPPDERGLPWCARRPRAATAPKVVGRPERLDCRRLRTNDHCCPDHCWDGQYWGGHASCCSARDRRLFARPARTDRPVHTDRPGPAAHCGRSGHHPTKSADPNSVEPDPTDSGSHDPGPVGPAAIGPAAVGPGRAGHPPTDHPPTGPRGIDLHRAALGEAVHDRRRVECCLPLVNGRGANHSTPVGPGRRLPFVAASRRHPVESCPPPSVDRTHPNLLDRTHRTHVRLRRCVSTEGDHHPHHDAGLAQGPHDHRPCPGHSRCPNYATLPQDGTGAKNRSSKDGAWTGA